MSLSRHSLCCCLVLGSGLAEVSAAARLFHSHQEYAAGVDPYQVAVADFDEDGAPDLAVVDLYENLIRILRGDGDGSFVPGPAVYPDQIERLADLLSGATGDFNADGHADLALGLTQPSWSKEGPDFVQVFYGTGRMTFTRGPDLAVGDYPTAMLADDLDGNGTLDLAVLDYVSGDVALLRGRGQDGFLAAEFLGVAAAGINLRAGDLDNDGHKDLVVGHLNPFAFLSILKGEAGGTFHALPRLPLPVLSASALLVADLDGDALDDLAVGNEPADQVLVMLNQTGPSGPLLFAGPAIHTVASPVDLVAADLDGDAVPDLAAAGLTVDVVTVLTGRADGSFKRGRVYKVGDVPADLEAADLNGDGLLDLVTADFGSTVSVLLHR